MSPPVAVEICVDSVASALAAERGGAARVELCGNLLEGGVTPSAGWIELTRAKISIGLQVMIRPRGGDFSYTPEEFEAMRRDIAMAKRAGVDGVVLGILNLDGSVDVERSGQLVELARPLNVTFHRAFDASSDLFEALEDVCKTGAERLLTSGGEPSAMQAVPVIASLVKAARGRITIMACGAIRTHNAASIIEETGVAEIHVGLKSAVDTSAARLNRRIAMGTAVHDEYQRFEVREEEVRALCRAVAHVRS